MTLDDNLKDIEIFDAAQIETIAKLLTSDGYIFYLGNSNTQGLSYSLQGLTPEEKKYAFLLFGHALLTLVDKTKDIKIDDFVRELYSFYRKNR